MRANLSPAPGPLPAAPIDVPRASPLVGAGSVCSGAGAEPAFQFYLGAHHPGWLSVLDIPLFVSRRRLVGYKRLPRARVGWAQDSGGFSELSLAGAWSISARQYARETVRYAAEIGRLDFAAPQDWMCEPHVLRRTGLGVAEHIRRTVSNYVALREAAPQLPWMPVLQGWRLGDYLRCVEEYARRGVDLVRAARVGVGTLCRRQSTREALDILARLAGLGLRLHGFGFKISGLGRARSYLRSADSMAWSFTGRRSAPLAGCRHKNCANCPRFAQQWYERVIRLPALPHQLALDWGGTDGR